VLTPSGDIAVSTPGAVISNMNVAGSIDVRASNVTIKNTRITVNGAGCGTASTCGNSGIKIGDGVTGTLIQDVEITTAPGTTVEHAVRNQGGPTTKAVRLYAHGPDSAWHGVGDIEDSYTIAALAIPPDHVENIYNGGGDGQLTVNHDTMYNPINQTAVVFNKGDFGIVSKITITNSLLAGGGASIYTSNGPGGTVKAPIIITGNRFARCLGPAKFDGSGYNCSGLAVGANDGHGYYPYSGRFGLFTTDNDAAINWSGNYWDDCPTQAVTLTDSWRPPTGCSH
jgi:hypothetical protein